MLLLRTLVSPYIKPLRYPSPIDPALDDCLQFDQAYALLRTAIRLGQEIGPTSGFLAHAYASMGHCYRRAKEYKLALAFLERSVVSFVHTNTLFVMSEQEGERDWPLFSVSVGPNSTVLVSCAMGAICFFSSNTEMSYGQLCWCFHSSLDQITCCFG